MTYKLPDGSFSTDQEEYLRAWDILSDKVRNFFPGYVEHARDPGLEFIKWRIDDRGYSRCEDHFVLSVAAINALTSPTAPLDRARRLRAMMSPRKLVFRFMNLTYDRRIQIADEFSLIREEDKKLSEPDFTLRLLQRASELGQLEKVWEAMECDPSTNQTETKDASAFCRLVPPNEAQKELQRLRAKLKKVKELLDELLDPEDCTCDPDYYQPSPPCPMYTVFNELSERTAPTQLAPEGDKDVDVET